MKVKLTRPILGYRQSTIDGVKTNCRVHADEGDVVHVIFHNATHFICESVKYPNQHMAVFPSQCEIVEERIDRSYNEDPHDIEKYFHVYDEYQSSNNDDTFYSDFRYGDETD